MIRWWAASTIQSCKQIGWPEPYICTAHDRVFGEFPAQNTLYTPDTYGSGQPYKQTNREEHLKAHCPSCRLNKCNRIWSCTQPAAKCNEGCRAQPKTVKRSTLALFCTFSRQVLGSQGSKIELEIQHAARLVQAALHGSLKLLKKQCSFAIESSTVT